MNILLLEQDYLSASNKRAHSACHSVQIARLMQEYTNNKVYILANPESALLSSANKQKIQCLAEPSGFFTSLKFALLLKRYKIDIVHTFDLLSAGLAVKALSFASSVKHIHSENRNTEKDDMLLSHVFKKLDACIFAHKSFEGQYKFKYIYQENHRPVDFYVADIFPCVDILKKNEEVIALEEVEIINNFIPLENEASDVSETQVDSEQDSALIKAFNEKEAAQSLGTSIKDVHEEKARQEELDKAIQAKYHKFLPFSESNKRIRFLIPYSATLTDVDTVANSLRCFNEYEGHIYKWEAYFIGPDVDFEKILKYAKKHEIQDNIAIFKKEIDEEDYSKSEICIVSTFKDEYNLEELFKSWACAKPTIISQRMPYYEKAVNGKSVLVPDLDTALSLSSVMHKLVQNVESRAIIVENAKSMDFEKLAKESARKYDTLYSEVKEKQENGIRKNKKNL